MIKPTNQASSTGRQSPAERFRHFLHGVMETAQERGLSRGAAEALVGIDASAFAVRRRMLKRELVLSILGPLGLDIEHTEFEALTAISRLTYGVVGVPMTCVTIGDVAEEMSIDPSRASRLVAGLVRKGYARRAAAQDDGRKSVLALTGASLALLDAFLTLKWDIMIDVFASWSENDIADFERLFSHYVGAFADMTNQMPKNPAATARHAAVIRSALETELKSRE